MVLYVVTFIRGNIKVEAAVIGNSPENAQRRVRDRYGDNIYILCTVCTGTTCFVIETEAQV